MELDGVLETLNARLLLETLWENVAYYFGIPQSALAVYHNGSPILTPPDLHRALTGDDAPTLTVEGPVRSPSPLEPASAARGRRAWTSPAEPLLRPSGWEPSDA